MNQTPLVDLLFAESYYQNLCDEQPGSYNKFVAALSALISLGTYEESDHGITLKGTVAQRLGLRSKDIQIDRIDVDAPALLIDTNAFIVRIPSPCSGDPHSKLVFVAFRGTEFLGRNFLVDVFTDARAVAVDFPAEKSFVHGGFLNAADFVWSQLLDNLVPAEDAPASLLETRLAGQGNTIDRLYFVGHSLGGAVAVLAAARLMKPLAPLQKRMERARARFGGVYTFGQPAVGGRIFAERSGLSDKLFRHVNKSDWVPQVPPKSIGTFDWQFYQHFGAEFRVNAEGAFEPTAKRTKTTLLASTGLIAALPFFLRPFRALPFIPWSIEDHQPEYYLRACERALLPANQTIVESQRRRATHSDDQPSKPNGNGVQPGDGPHT